MLATVPDLRSAPASADPEKQADISERLDVTATYDKPNRRLQLAATISAGASLSSGALRGREGEKERLEAENSAR